MHELDRVFDGDNMIVPVEIRMIDHCRERGRFTGTGRAGDKDQALLQHRKFFQDLRQSQFINRQYLRRNRAERGRDAVLLLEEIDAVAHHVRNFIAKIDIEPFFEFLDLSFRRNFINHRFQLVVLQRWKVDPDQIAVDPQHRRVVGREMKIGSFLFRHQLEKGVNASHGRRCLRS